MNCFNWLAVLPNRVGVPKMTASAHSMSATVATGMSLVTVACADHQVGPRARSGADH